MLQFDWYVKWVFFPPTSSPGREMFTTWSENVRIRINHGYCPRNTFSSDIGTKLFLKFTQTNMVSWESFINLSPPGWHGIFRFGDPNLNLHLSHWEGFRIPIWDTLLETNSKFAPRKFQWLEDELLSF